MRGALTQTDRIAEGIDRVDIENRFVAVEMSITRGNTLNVRGCRMKGM